MRTDTLDLRKWRVTAARVVGGKSRDPDIHPFKINNDIIDNELDKAAGAFNKFFVFASQSNITDDNKSVPTLDSVPDRHLNSTTFTENDVKYIIQKININKATGSDGISPRLLRVATIVYYIQLKFV